MIRRGERKRNGEKKQNKTRKKPEHETGGTKLPGRKRRRSRDICGGGGGGGGGGDGPFASEMRLIDGV